MGERNTDVRETLVGCLPQVPRLRTKCKPRRVCALTGNRTSDLSVCGPSPNPLSHPSCGCFIFLIHSSPWSSVFIAAISSLNSSFVIKKNTSLTNCHLPVLTLFTELTSCFVQMSEQTQEADSTFSLSLQLRILKFRSFKISCPRNLTRKKKNWIIN